MAVNGPSPRAQPEDKVCLRHHKSMATCALTIIYPTWLVKGCALAASPCYRLPYQTKRNDGFRKCCRVCRLSFWSMLSRHVFLDWLPWQCQLREFYGTTPSKWIFAPPTKHWRRAPPRPSVDADASAEPRPPRFAAASDEELAKLAEGLTQANTVKKTNWAVKNFQQWMAVRNQCNPQVSSDDILLSSDPELLNRYFSRFNSWNQKVKWRALATLLCGLLRYMRSKNPACPNFLDKQDNRFKSLQGTLDSYFHRLHSEGVGRTKHAEIMRRTRCGTKV